MALTSQRKPTTMHKKLRGEHHHHGKHYLKTYSPYLPLLVLVIIGLAVNSIWSSHSQVLGASTNLTANQLLSGTNTQRLGQDENNLTLDPQLEAAAQAKANDMAKQDYWAHNAPNGQTPWSFIHQSGYNYQAAGENLAYGFMDANGIITGWMNSPAHRANLLNASYRNVGFGITTAPNYVGKGPTTIVVAMYGEPLTDTTGAAILDSSAGGFASAVTTGPFHEVSRIQMLTGGVAAWSYMGILLLIVIATITLITRHAFAWHRVIIKSEDFVLRHKLLDIIVAVVIVGGLVLTRTAGFIN